MRNRRRSTSFASVSGGAPTAANAFLTRSSARLSRKPDSVSIWSSMNVRTPGRLVGERALVELGEDRVARAGEEVGRDLVASLRDRVRC